MSTTLTHNYFDGLVSELRKLPVETGWVEFKENYSNPEEIGEYLSALSNTAALQGKANGYLVWGIQNTTHAVVGTTFKPANEERERRYRKLAYPSSESPPSFPLP